MIAPGDIVDKLTILLNKKAHIQDKNRIQFVEDEIERTLELLNNILSIHPVDESSLIDLSVQLSEVNKKQWDLEDKVRTEHSWEYALRARKNNDKRVKVKNFINKLFNYPVEQKEYQEKELENDAAKIKDSKE